MKEELRGRKIPGEENDFENTDAVFQDVNMILAFHAYNFLPEIMD